MTHDNTHSLRPASQHPGASDFTLPSVVAAGRGRYAGQALTLTIAFHPDTQRIGEVAQVPTHNPRLPFVLGRRSPQFSQPGSADEAPLEDPYVSRRAITLEYEHKQLRLSRFSGSSRVRLGGSQLVADETLDEATLRSGVPLLLGHSVVLLMRLVDADEQLESQPMGSPDSTLRGSGPLMRQLRREIALAAGCGEDVLIRGETGTGKELVAQAIHDASARGQRPMVNVNMAAVPTDLAPALLFGSVRGAFTGAERNTPGYFEQADGGTLFLDEIGDTPLPVQAQILRALQQREIQVVGGPIRPVDVRIVSATDALIDEDVSHFKSALRHRLGALEIALPPLRAHPEDIGELLAFFAIEAAQANGREEILLSADSSAVDIAAWAFTVYLALRYHWPGNVRELRNVVRQMVLSAPRAMDLPERFEMQVAHRRELAEEPAVDAAPRRLADVNEAAFAEAMSNCDFEPARVARELCVSRTAVYRRIQASERYQLASDLTQESIVAALTAHDGDEVAAARELEVSVGGLRQRWRLMGSKRR